MLSAVFNEPALANLWRLTHWSYAHAAVLFLGRSTLLSSNGVRQGDVLGPLLFAVGLRPLLQATLAAFPVKAFAILDDIFITGPPLTAVSAGLYLRDKAPAFGLEVRADKSKFIWWHGHPVPPGADRPSQDFSQMGGHRVGEAGHPGPLEDPAQRSARLAKAREEAERAAALAASAGFRVERDVCFLLGVFMGPPRCDAHVTARLENEGLGRLLDTLKRTDLGWSIHDRQILLRLCHLPTLNYWSRVIPPHILQSPASQFDGAWYEYLTDLLVLSPPEAEAAQKRIALPFRFGGNGYRRVSDLLPLAHWACLAQAAPYLLEHNLVTPGCPFLEAGSRTLQEVKAMLQDADPEATNALLPLDGTPWAEFYATGAGQKVRRGLQGSLTAIFFAAASRDIEASLPPGPRAGFVSLCQKNAALWADVPSALEDASATVAFRLRAGLSPIPPELLPPFCFCGADLRQDPWHLLACPRLSHVNTAFRHDPVAKCLVGWCDRLGGKGRWDRSLPLFEGHRVDADLDFGSALVSIDVAIPNPGCPSNCGKGSRALGVAKFFEDVKLRKFHTLCAARGAFFVPAVLETHGAWGPSWQALLKHFASFSAHRSPDSRWDPEEVLTAMKEEISTLVQRGNAAAVFSTLREIRQHVHVRDSPMPPPPNPSSLGRRPGRSSFRPRRDAPVFMPAGPDRVQQEAVAHPAQHEDLASSEVWEGGDWISPTRESGSSPSTVGRNEVGSRHTPREGPPPSWGGGEGLVSTREPFSFSPSASGGSEEGSWHPAPVVRSDGSGSSLDYSVGNRQFSVQLPGVCRGEGLDGRARYGMSSLSRGGRGPRGRGGVHPGTLFCSPRLPSPPPTTAAAASATATRSTSVLCTTVSFPFTSSSGAFTTPTRTRGGGGCAHSGGRGEAGAQVPWSASFTPRSSSPSPFSPLFPLSPSPLTCATECGGTTLSGDPGAAHVDSAPVRGLGDEPQPPAAPVRGVTHKAASFQAAAPDRGLGGAR